MEIKKIFMGIVFSTIAVNSFAQILEPVKWNYSAKKITDKTYEVHLTATIDNGWHIYAQRQPKDAIAIPTTIKFNKNPLLILNGKIKETGKKEKYKEPTLGIEQWQYSDKVDFVQQVKLKSNTKTNISGSVVFQVCTDEKCLPAKTIPFTILLK